MLEELLLAVGEHLEAARSSAAIVVVGGSSLIVRGWVQRVTNDVDVIAQMVEKERERVLVAPDPLPPALLEAVHRVARDYALPPTWLNTQVGMQWKFGLPEAFEEEIDWRDYRALRVGFAGRNGTIALKLFATVDQGVRSVHCQDLLALQPSENELARAAKWVAQQDVGEEFPKLVTQAVDYVRSTIAGSRGSAS